MANKLNKRKKNEWRKAQPPRPVGRLSDLIPALFSTLKCIEPLPRMCGGKFTRPRHRFPIKAGVSLNDLLRENVTRNNVLWAQLKERWGKNGTP